MAGSLRLRLLSAGIITIGLVVAPAVAHADTGSSASSSAPADAQSAPDEATASAIAQAYGHAVVVTGDMTSTEQTSALPDGTMQLSESSVPVRAQDATGAWQPLDLDLSADSSGMLAPALTASPVEFSAGGSGPMARVHSPDGSWLSVSWPGGSLPMPTVSGATATYGAVYPGVDLVLTATPIGMSEVLVVESAQAAANPALSAVSFGVSGATLSVEPGTGNSAGLAASPSASSGSAAVAASDGLSAPSPAWWDSQGAGASAAGPGGDQSTDPVPDAVSSSAVTVNAGSVASQPGLTYPVYVDPTWPETQDNYMYVDATFPNIGYYDGAGGADACAPVGYVDAAWSADGQQHTDRSMWQMDLTKVAGKDIVSAEFEAKEVWSSTNHDATEVDLRTIPTGFGTGTTWNNQPAQGPVQDSKDLDAGWVQGATTSCPAATSGDTQVGWDATAATAAAVGAGRTYVDFELAATNADETNQNPDSWKKFRSATTLQIDYISYPSAPTMWLQECSRTPGMIAGDQMHSGDKYWSGSGMFYLSMQSDGNLVLYKATTTHVASPATALWSTQTNGEGGDNYATLQSDGNLVLYSADTGTALWQSGTSGKQMAHLVIQDDGNLVGYNSSQSNPQGNPLWYSNTRQNSTSPAFSCYTTSVVPHLDATSTSPDGLNLTYIWTLHNNATGTDSTWDQQTQPYASGAVANLKMNTMAAGSYYFTVQACAAEYNVRACTPSGKFSFVIDTTPPPAPTLSVVSGNVSTSASTHQGVVGQEGPNQEVMSINPGTSTDTWGFTYAILPTGAQTVFPTNPACGTSINGFVTVCGQVGQPIQVQVDMPSELSQMTAEAFDLAGNVASNSSSPTSFYAQPDTSVSTSSNAGHAWLTDTGNDPSLSTNQASAGSVCPAPTTSDSADPAGTGADLSALGTGVCDTYDPTAPPTQPGNSTLTFPGTTAGNATTSKTGSTQNVINTSASFSVGSWVYLPALPTAGSTQTFMSEKGSANSGFFLQAVPTTSNGTAGAAWQFCLDTQTSHVVQSCVTSAANSVSAGQWWFVSGVYDAQDRLLMLYWNTDGRASTPTVASVAAVTGPSATGALELGGAWANSAAANPFTGSLLDPFAAQAVFGSTQLPDAANLQAPAHYTYPQ